MTGTSPCCLGDFLSGMETRMPPGSPAAEAPLGNFLSGMETYPLSREFQGYAVLGNFLSGMETQAPNLRLGPGEDPWKLP